MRTDFVLAVVSLVALVQAHPLIIVNTKITEIHAAPTHHLQARQGFLDSLTSVLGLGDPDTAPTPTPPTKTTQSAIALPPPATVGPSQPSSTSSDEDEDESSTTESSTSTSSSSSSSSSTTPTSASSVTKTSATPVATTSAIPSPDSSQSGGISSGGIAVAVIMILLVLAISAWLVFKYHPKSQAWWAAREERRFRERSYRENIDNKPPTHRQTLKTFFAPNTAHLGGGQQIRRKPVNWGEPTPPVPQKEFPQSSTPSTPAPAYDTEKISITEDAAPMGFNAEPLGHIMRYSYIPPPPPIAPQSLVSPMSVAHEPLDRLPPISPMSLKPVNSTKRGQDRDLPPVPALPGLTMAKRGSDGVFRL